MLTKRLALIGRLQASYRTAAELPIGRLFEAIGRLRLLVIGYRQGIEKRRGLSSYFSYSEPLASNL